MEDQQERACDAANHAVDITSLAQRLRAERDAANSWVAQVGGGSSPPPTIVIGLVDNLTREVDPVEYDPHYVSIGPYHRDRNPGLARDGDKLRSLTAVLAARPGLTEEEYLRDLAGLVDRARSCYAHKFDRMSSADFLRMLLLDGCYVLDQFGDFHGHRGDDVAAAAANGYNAQGEHHSSGGGGCSKLDAVAMARDVFYLAENQIPFFVVDRIHRLTVLDGDGGTSAAERIAGYVRKLCQRQRYTAMTTLPQSPSEPGNLLHLLHMHLRPAAAELPRATGGKPVGRWRTATEYYFAGVRFKRRRLGKGGAGCILDVRLDSGGGVLEVPCLSINGETWPLLRNLMALEQHNPEAAGSFVTAYCVFMWQVACTANDVERLSKVGVIEHSMGNHGEVAGCFADLCKGIVFSLDDPRGNYLRATCQALERRFRSRLRRWMAWLGRKYFDNPWVAAGLAAAAVGLACTVVQTVYTVLSYKQGVNQKCYCV